MAYVTKGLLAGLVLLGAVSVAHAQTRPAVTSLGPNFPKPEMFIGNSFFYYNNGMPSHFSQLEKAADPEHKGDYRATMITIGGSGFDRHDIESYFRPNAIGSAIPITRGSTSRRRNSCRKSLGRRCRNITEGKRGRQNPHPHARDKPGHEDHRSWG